MREPLADAAGTESFWRLDRLPAMNAYDLAFFEKHLTGMTEPLLDGPTPYTEVTFTKR